jgi:hypothetical protein
LVRCQQAVYHQMQRPQNRLGTELSVRLALRLFPRRILSRAGVE